MQDHKFHEAPQKKKRRHNSLQSFKYAWKGLITVCTQERNFRWQVLIMLMALLGAWFLECSPMEWVAIILCSGFVFFAEAANTVIEEMVDWLHPDYNPRAGKIKDMGAALPLIAAITSFITALLIFGPKLLVMVQSNHNN